MIAARRRALIRARNQLSPLLFTALLISIGVGIWLAVGYIDRIPRQSVTLGAS